MGALRISVCITTFNEEKTIVKLLDSLLHQTKVADEIVIVDGGSKDKTLEHIKKFKKIKLIIAKDISIAEGRNLSVTNAKHEIIVMTDGGCICEKDWLKRIATSFEDPNTKVVAGFYKMTGKTNFQKALKPFLGIMPSIFSDSVFLPSTRSIAFKKSVWKQIDGFNEELDSAGEDTDFNLKLLKHNFSIVRKKDAIVYWEVPGDLYSASRKFFYYARGDAQIGGLTKHNLKVITIFLRYILFLVFWPLLFIYLIWSIYKHRKFLNNWQQRVYTVIIQVVSDFSVMLGFIFGTWGTLNK